MEGEEETPGLHQAGPRELLVQTSVLATSLCGGLAVFLNESCLLCSQSLGGAAGLSPAGFALGSQHQQPRGTCGKRTPSAFYTRSVLRLEATYEPSTVLTMA